MGIKKTFRKVFIACFSIVLMVMSCKKEETNPEESITYTLEVSEALPMQQVIVISSDSTSKVSQMLKIQDQSVELRKINGKEWRFLCPVLSPGKYTIQFENKFELDFTVQVYTPIQNPETNLDLFKNEIGDIETSIAGLETDTKQDMLNMLSYYKQALQESWTSLTPEEKLQLAYFISSNKYDQPGFSDVFLTDIPDSLTSKRAAIFDATDAADLFIINYTSAKFNYLLSSGTAIAFFLAPDPTFITKGLAVVSAISAITNLAVIYRLIDHDLPKLLMKAVDIEAFKKRSAVLYFVENQPLELKSTGTFNNLTAKDGNAGIFPDLFAGVIQINEKIKSFYNGYRKVKSWFMAAAPVENEKLLLIGSAVEQKQLYLNPKYISVKSVSRQDIDVKLSTIGSQMFLTAKGTGLTTRTSFSITLKYNQANIKHAVEETILAELDPTLYIGQSYQGGIIGYFFNQNDSGYVQGEQHGIIVAPEDCSSPLAWGCSGVNANATVWLNAGQSYIGYGKKHTANIVKACSTANIAARYCDDLVLNGYTDWYLPSIDELGVLFLNKSKIGGFQGGYYWSSSEYNTSTAYYMEFTYDGTIYTYGKSRSFNVRAARSF